MPVFVIQSAHPKSKYIIQTVQIGRKRFHITEEIFFSVIKNTINPQIESEAFGLNEREIGFQTAPHYCLSFPIWGHHFRVVGKKVWGEVK
jgi:hypothetical protein